MEKILLIFIISVSLLMSCSGDEDTKQTHKQIKNDVWVLEWNSRSGEFASDLNKSFELYLTEEDANLRKEELQKAFIDVKNTSPETKIKVYKQK